MKTFKAGQTFAIEILLRLSRNATGTVLARRPSARIEFIFAMATHEFLGAHARIIGYSVNAHSVVLTYCRRAIVNVELAHFTRESCRALANEGVQLIGAGSAVHARIRGAFVDIDVTVSASPARLAATLIVGNLVNDKELIN